MEKHLALPPDLSIYTVAGLKADWLEALTQDEGGDEWPVDASALEEVDGAGLQMLLALERSLAARGQRLRLQGATQSLHAVFAAAGLAGLVEGAAS